MKNPTYIRSSALFIRVSLGLANKNLLVEQKLQSISRFYAGLNKQPLLHSLVFPANQAK